MDKESNPKKIHRLQMVHNVNRNDAEVLSRPKPVVLYLKILKYLFCGGSLRLNLWREIKEKQPLTAIGGFKTPAYKSLINFI